ncbi:MAG: T9SS type A sorting domain-containing protein [Bacteroidia bacterium]
MKKYSKPILLIYSLLTFTASQAQWEKLADIPEKLTFPVVTVLNGKIHVMGGGGTGGATDVHYRYHPETNTWDTLAPVPYKVQQPAGCAVAGRIHYFGGGFPNSGSPVASHYSYNPANNTWRKETNLTAARAIHYAVELNDTLYSIAGQGMKNLFQAYDTFSKKWINRADLLDDNYWYGAHVSTHGKIYRFGGGGSGAPKLDAHVYDPKIKTWSILPEMPERIHGLGGSAFGDSVYFGGGYASGNEFDKVWIFNLKTEQYINGPTLPSARDYLKFVTIGKCIYSVGGNSNSNANIPLSLIRHCPGITVEVESHIKNNEQIVVKTPPGKLKVELLTVTQPIKITLTDMAGRNLFSQIYPVDSPQNLEIETSNFRNGIYVLTISYNTSIYNQRIFINN